MHLSLDPIIPLLRIYFTYVPMKCLRNKVIYYNNIIENMSFLKKQLNIYNVLVRKYISIQCSCSENKKICHVLMEKNTKYAVL